MAASIRFSSSTMTAQMYYDTQIFSLSGGEARPSRVPLRSMRVSCAAS